MNSLTARSPFMTATPMINKPMELSGVLVLLWKETFAKEETPALEDFAPSAKAVRLKERVQVIETYAFTGAKSY